MKENDVNEVPMEVDNSKANNETNDTPKRKLSELIKERDELDAKAQEMLKETQSKEYSLNFKSKKIFDGVMKNLEKRSPWNAYTAAGLIMLYNNMNEQRSLIKDLINSKKEWDGVVKLRSANIAVLWKTITEMSGQGFYEAKDFVAVMANIGEDLSNAMRMVNESNQKIRDIHSEIDKIYQLIDNPEANGIEVDVDPNDIKPDTFQELSKEVNPEV